MASILKVDTLTGVTTAGSISVTGEGNSTTTNLQQGLAKALLNYQQNTPSVRDSFNVSSVTDVSTGIATANWSNNFNNANYYPNIMSHSDASELYTTNATRSTLAGGNAVFSTSAHQYLTHNIGGSVIDAYYNTGQYHGDLA
tara:strand:+ start:368 stop:793 length:426 start_codon:yes stop_codon:yes gene_type:complete